jgi:ribosomal subunit interface protein
MNIQLTFRDFLVSDSVRAHVENRASKLQERREKLIALKVALEAPHHHHHHGHTYRVRLELIVPGGEIVVASRDGAEGHTDLHVAIDDAFAAAERRLRSHAQLRRGDVKSRNAQTVRRPAQSN